MAKLLKWLERLLCVYKIEATRLWKWMRKFIWWFAAGTFVIVLLMGIGGIIDGYFYEDPWLSYPELPLRVQNAQVHAGDNLVLDVLRCNNLDTEEDYVTTRTLDPVGPGEDILLESRRISIKSGCHRIVSHLHLIPPETPPGWYTIYGISEVRGRIRTHYVKWRSDLFEVLPALPPKTN